MEAATLLIALLAGGLALPSCILSAVDTFSHSPTSARPISAFFAAVSLTVFILATLYTLPRLAGMS